jgi:Holliday junction DNA helicase RuvA
MYAFIEGNLVEKDTDRAVVQTGGVGYEIIMPQALLAQLPAKGSDTRIYTYFNVREDAHELYGFLSRAQKALFIKLISVSGVGPKAAMSILGVLSPEQAALAIVTEDIAALSSAPGVGKKTAQRIALELKEKIDNESLSSASFDAVGAVISGEGTEVIQALTALGYGPSDARMAYAAVKDKSEDVSELIRLALKAMDRQ